MATATSRYNADPALVAAIIQRESGWNPSALSPKGAIGLMQLLPSTAAQYGYSASDMYDPAKNIDAGTRYLAQLVVWFGESGTGVAATSCDPPAGRTAAFAKGLDYAIASYNGGPCANVESTSCPGQARWQCAENTGYQETREYVEAVKSFYSQYIAQPAVQPQTV
ncbi:MAG: lytic transglycosylase domain-containing protein [Candidatus Aenigmarchaeota archaeon]|nr:lytic transglycosylase domain-containing protein [Candidatus Aenigmarchaeota archaeon]